MFFPLLGAVWLAAAIAAGATGAVAALEPPLPQLTLAGLTVALLIGWRALPSFRSWVDSLSWRLIVSLHLTRFVGFYFLVCYSRGLLPYDFAVPGGIGDIAVATAAAVLFARPGIVQRNRRILLAWNLIGLADILFVVATAVRLAIADPASMGYLFVLPLSLLPTFLVPIIIASHIVLIARERRRA